VHRLKKKVWGGEDFLKSNTGEDSPGRERKKTNDFLWEKKKDFYVREEKKKMRGGSKGNGQVCEEKTFEGNGKHTGPG